MIAQRKHYACFYHITRLMILHLIVESLQVKEEPLSNSCDNYNEVTDPLAIEGIKLIKSEDHVIKNEVESENLLNDDLSSQPNLNMRTNEQINDLRTMKIKEEMWFYPGHVAMDKGTIKGSTKNFITYKSINNSLNDGIINENSIECNCAYGDVTIENLIENISSENKLFEQKGKKLGSQDVRASATAKATVAAFAASEGHAHPRVVELPKTEEGLGFNVMGGKEQNSPIYISRIIPGGVADKHGGLKRGDQLLSVNGVSVEGENHEKAVELLKQAQGSVKLVVRYTPKVLEEMEMRFDKQRAARRRQQY
ncbi:uncharacterized protein LOC142328649 [Lycorma delicatula]|uniref:uncharacterized protein LOC142328649 n=1 Tax=Lycorma delicatula TaxID=130591 RepID=UPI003F50F940